MSRDEGASSQESRSKADAKSVTKANYDRLSRWYDWMAGSSERKAVQAGLDLLAASEGETILEIGYGTGRAIEALARAVGESGHGIGIDISDGMRRVATARVQKAGLSEQVELVCGDATFLAAELTRNATPPLLPKVSSRSPGYRLQPEKAGLPLSLKHPEGMRDAIFMSFTLELFEEPEIPLLLAECRRVLKPSGRMVVVSMEKKANANAMVKLYEWAHRTFPKVVDCRPIHADRALAEAGFRVTQQTEMRMWGLPVSIVLAKKA
ncbi:class I SAM-dependent methyltransferase [Candidatus Bipolaricaulota bacterium]